MVENIPLNKIKLGKNSRLTVKDAELEGLMQSIKEQGMLQPIGVVKRKTGYEICYGNRRFLACSKLGYAKIPAIVHEGKKESDVDLKNLTENIQRRNISLAEAGRYIQLLLEEKLSMGEIAVRLGVSKSYVQSCLSAFNEVPEEYRPDLEMQRGSQKLPPGKISISTAQKIISARKNLGITRTDAKKLFEAAKTDSRFKTENVFRYASAIRAKKADPIGSVMAVKHVSVSFAMTEEDYNKLHEKHVINGPFNSVAGLIRAVVSGKKAVRIPIIERSEIE